MIVTLDDFLFFCAFYKSLLLVVFYNTETFLIEKELKDRNLTIKLRTKGKITAPKKPFQLSRKTEYDDLIIKGVFIIISKYNPCIKSHKIFKFRMVNKIKNK